MKKTMNLLLLYALGLCSLCLAADPPVNSYRPGLWMKFEKSFQSSKAYDNPLYDVEQFTVRFSSPSGRVKMINGFWDGGLDWKVRFCPDETGLWTYVTECSDQENNGLQAIQGSFKCVKNNNRLDIYTKGCITRPGGSYHLAHTDGTPFFWCACTAWNGALRSTDEEWDVYLEDRVKNGYSVIQFVTTQWRGCEANRLGQVAFTGSGKIRINPDFFKHLDSKVDRINEYGLVAAPVLLWALPWGLGKELSPGYYLPDNEAVLLARYMVARYGGNHVIWILGGDGHYVEEYEQRWKNIGRGVFGEEHPGLVAQHPHGRSWIGRAYAEEDWLDIVGYQSSHGNGPEVVRWINQGPVSEDWQRLPPKPTINMEPNYEEIFFRITPQDVRNASYWSVLAAPVSGITYGANGIWPWLREGESILNHPSLLNRTGEHTTHPWHESIKFPGSLQVGYLAEFFRNYEWWRLRPAPELLAEQPGDSVYNHFISVAKTDNHDLIIAYLPLKTSIMLYNPLNNRYSGTWFNPSTNRYSDARIHEKNNLVEATSTEDCDMLLVLKKLAE
jgi:Protein of unknown function (DUF4038)/Domain of unknown function (DUF5060)